MYIWCLLGIWTTIYDSYVMPDEIQYKTLIVRVGNYSPIKTKALIRLSSAVFAISHWNKQRLHILLTVTFYQNLTNYALTYNRALLWHGSAWNHPCCDLNALVLTTFSGDLVTLTIAVKSLITILWCRQKLNWFWPCKPLSKCVAENVIV